MKKNTLGITLGAVALFLLACTCGVESNPATDDVSGVEQTQAAGSIQDRSENPVDDSNNDKNTSVEFGLGQKVRDGKFEFVVNKVTCGSTEIGYFSKAQGHYCLVNLNVTNIGERAQSFSAGKHTAFDLDGRQFEADSMATSEASDNVGIWDNINPGNSIQVNLVFDMPKAVEPVKVKLHDGYFSNGVSVNLK